MDNRKDALLKHLYSDHGSYPGSLDAASPAQLIEWHTHQHRVHQPIHGGSNPEYGKVDVTPEQGHNPNVPKVARHHHKHGREYMVIG